jgi:acyl CoA:acetate/3-ketoacid CoA transferase beta subunit
MPTLYKVLDAEGRSCHNDANPMQWSLPVEGKPGAWHEVKGKIRVCENGLHLTDDPARWFKYKCRIFEVEAEGVEGDFTDDNDRKVVARKARLVRELADEKELAGLRIFKSGIHEVKDGVSVAYGSSQVRATGSSQVTAYGSSQVTAYGSSQVTATGSSQVTAYGSSQVTAYGSSQVTATGSSQVTAYDSSQVTAYDSSQVRAYGSSQVRAYGSSQVRAYDSSQVTAYGSSQVTATGSSQVTAYGSSQVTAYGSSQVTATGSSQVTATGSSQVTAYDSSQVTAYDSSQVRALNYTTCVIFHGQVQIKELADQAVIVDRRGEKPIITVASAPSKAEARP